MSQLQTQQSVSLESLLANIRDGVFILDGQRRIVFFSPACERLTGFTAAEVAGTGCQCNVVTDCKDEHGRTLAGRLCPGMQVLRGDVSSVKQRVHITTKSGQDRWVQVVYTGLAGSPGHPEYVIAVMRDATEERVREEQWLRTISELRVEVEGLREEMHRRYGFANLVTRSPLMQAALERTRAACANASPVLICGEPGCGKEMLARTIHCNSLQKSGAFIAFNVCGTPADRIDVELFGSARADNGSHQAGLFLAADDGTLFIKDVDKLPNSTQAKLLQTIQDRAVRPIGGTSPTPASVRIIAATSRSPEELVSTGALREDLYYRLSVITIELPPLRRRKEDIPLLVEHFVGQLNAQSTRQVDDVAPEVWAALSAHEWPGNVRELQNVIESAFAASPGNVLGPEVLNLAGGQARDRSKGGPESVALDELLCDTERRAILAALRRARGQRSLAAKLMGISRSRLYRRMEALGLASSRNEP